MFELARRRRAEPGQDLLSGFVSDDGPDGRLEGGDLVEELLRYEPSVHFLPNRTTVADIEIAGTTIKKGHPVVLVLASGSRDPQRFPHPERFDPDRVDNVHLGFGSGIHYCFGAPLARLEAQVALTQLAKRLENPRLIADPPPYRPSPVLRGPIHLPIAYDGAGPA